MYTYHRDLPPAARAYLDTASQNDVDGWVYRQKDADHLAIKTLSEKRGGANEYFTMAPPEMKYESLAKAMG